MMVLDLIASAKADQIQQDYPDARPATETRMMEEGTVEMIEETLYPDSKRQITLYYDSKEGKKGDLDQIWLMQEDSPWELASGLTVGMRLDKLNELNAKLIEFGFVKEKTTASVEETAEEVTDDVEATPEINNVTEEL